MIVPVCSLPNFPGQRGRVPRAGGSPDGEPRAEERPAGVRAGAAPESPRALAGRHCGHHHGLLPALRSQRGERPRTKGETRGG